MVLSHGRYGGIRAIVGVSLIATLGLVFAVSLCVPGETVSIVARFTIPPGLQAGVDPGSLSFTINPDASPSNTVTVQVEVCTNDPPTAFSIGLLPNGAGLDFSYRLIEIGGDSIPILPNVSLQNLPSLGCTSYELEITATAAPDLSADSYHRDVELWFQAASIIRTYPLHLDITVLVNPMTMAEASLATPEVAGGGAAIPEVAIDELYVHHEALTVSQFHLVSPGAPENPSAPVIYFPFDEGGGKYVYNEIDRRSGKEPVLKGTLSQAEWIKGKPVHGNAFALSLEEDGYVEIPADQRMSFSWNQDFALELWVRTTDSTAERALVQRQGPDNGTLYELSLFEGVPLFYAAATAANYAIVKGRESIADGTWHHIACMRDAGALKLYLDGDLVDELLPEARIAGAGGANLSSQEPTYVGGLGEAGEPMGGLVDAIYRVGEPIEFRMRLRDETGTPLTDACPSLLFIRYDNAGQQVESGFIGQLTYNPDEEQYAYSLDTSTCEDGMYDFFLVSGDGSQERLRILLLEVE